MCPAHRTSPPYFPPSRLPVFGWLLCEPLLIDGCLRWRCFSCLFIFCRSIRRPKQWNGVSPCALPPTRLRYNIPIIATTDSRLIVVCHLFSSSTSIIPVCDRRIADGSVWTGRLTHRRPQPLQQSACLSRPWGCEDCH